MNLDDIRQARVVFTREQVPQEVAGDRRALAEARRLVGSFGPDVIFLATDEIEERGVIMPLEVYDALILQADLDREAVA